MRSARARIAKRGDGPSRGRFARIPVAYGSYEALLADPQIEAIYNPLPNHLHVPLTLMAAAAGKHVLFEKPIALTAIEAEQLRRAQSSVLIAEAFMVRFHPQWLPPTLLRDVPPRIGARVKRCSDPYAPRYRSRTRAMRCGLPTAPISGLSRASGHATAAAS